MSHKGTSKYQIRHNSNVLNNGEELKKKFDKNNVILQFIFTYLIFIFLFYECILLIKFKVYSICKVCYMYLLY